MTDLHRAGPFPETYKGFAAQQAPASAAEPARPAQHDPRRAPAAPVLASLAGLVLVGVLAAGLGYGLHATQPTHATQVSPAAAPAVSRAPALSAPAILAEPDTAATARPVRERGAPASPATGPAFHCDWPLRISERLICQSPTLAALDRQLNHAFAAAVRAGVPRARLRAQQDAWVYRRDTVARRAPAALESYYRKRIAELEVMAGPQAERRRD